MTAPNYPGLVKILFRIERDAQGWPPTDIEGMWAKRGDDNEFLLHNTPFYAQGVAIGDVVSGVEENGEFYFHEVLREGGHGTIRVLLKSLDQVDLVCSKLEMFGCEVEVSQRLIAVDVRPEVAIKSLLNYLEGEEQASRFGYEVACQFW